MNISSKELKLTTYQNNLAELKKRSEFFASQIEEAKLPESYETIDTKTNDVTVSITINDKNLLLHSKYDPVKEAKRSIDNFDKKPEILIIGGIGLGYSAQVACDSLPNTKILVLEKDLSLFKLALTLRDLRNIISNENIEFIITEKGEEVIQILQDLNTKNIAISLHRPSTEVYPDTYKNISKLVNSFVNSREINIATLSRFQKLWTKNILNNAFSFIKHKGINILFDKFENTPAIIVAAGPSLKKNIEELKKVKNKGIIIAVDTVFKRLVDSGIIPDFVLAVDPQDKITKFFSGVHCPETILITESTVSKKIISRYPGPILFTTSVFEMGKWLEEYSSHKGEIDVGGCVATAAYGLAVKMKCSPIVFCGLDLAYPDGETHFKGAYFEDNWLNEADKINSALTLYKKFMRQHEFMEVPFYYDQNETIKTDRKFLMFLWWFESKFKFYKDKVIDATEGGSFKKHAIQMPLRETIEKYCTIPINKDFYKNTIEDNYISEAKKFLKDIEKTMVDLKEILKLVTSGIKYSEEFYSLMSDHIIRKKPKSDKINSLLKKLDKIDNKVQNSQTISGILSLSIQKTINSVLHNFDNCLSDLEKEHDELRISRQSIMLYEAVKDACEFNLHHLKRTKLRFDREIKKIQ